MVAYRTSLNPFRKQPDHANCRRCKSSAAAILEDRQPKDNINKCRTSTANNVHRLLCDLKSSSITRNLQWGKQIHAKVLQSGNHVSNHIATALVNMYAKCSSMVQARQVFDSIQQLDEVSWNTLILGYAENGEGHTALDLFSRMKSQGFSANSITYVAVLKACGSIAQTEVGSGRLKVLERAREIHAEIGCHMNLYVQNALMDMYARCGCMTESHQVFDGIKQPDVVSWTTLIMGYADNGEGVAALDLFSEMKSHGCTPNSITYVAALKACTSLVLEDANARVECLERGRQVHLEIGLHLNLHVQNTLLDMYCKCGSMVEAHQVFNSIRNPNVMSWNILLLGYAENDEGRNALELFSTMKSLGYKPDCITYVAALKACTYLAQREDGIGSSECLKQGMQIHLEIGRSQDLCVQTALVDMYAKCCSMVKARQVFDSIRQPDVICWTALILGYAENGEGLIALDMLVRMKSHGCVPDCVTYVAALKACTSLGALECGRRIHAEIVQFNGTLVACLVDFYAKSGCLAEAQEVFNVHCKIRDVAAWNSLIAGYSSFGEVDSVFALFKSMQDEGFQPDGLTFLWILTCCSHAGLVEKAKFFFEMMFVQHKIVPTVKHYNSMVDVLGRANKLDDAICMLGELPCRPDSATWMTILDSCRKWKHVKVGILAFHCLVSLDKENAAPYVIMAQIYASKDMWREQSVLLEMKPKQLN